jgi:hypothetical protein
MRKARVKALNGFMEELKTKGTMTHDDGLRYIMRLEMVSRLTAERYIQDLLFMGRIKEKDDKLSRVE